MSINSKYICGKSSRLRAQVRNRMLESAQFFLGVCANLQLEVRQKLWEIPKKPVKYTVKNHV